MPDKVTRLRIAKAVGARQQAAVESEFKENLFGEVVRGELNRRTLIQKLPREGSPQFRVFNFFRDTDQIKRIFVVVGRI